MKKTIKVLGIILLVLLSLLVFHFLNTNYLSNIINRTLMGISLVLTPVLIALVLVYLINPFTDWLIEKRNVKKGHAIIITIIIILIIIIGLFYFVITFIIKQGYELFNVVMSADFIDSIKNWFVTNNMEDVYIYLEDFITNFDYLGMLPAGSSIIAGLIQLITTVVLVPLFLWHILNNKDTLFDKVSDNLPETWKKHVIPVAIKSNEVVVGYFRSKIISIILLFVMFSALYLILGLPIGYVIFFAGLISLLDLIPYVGPTVGLLIPIIYIFSVDGVSLFYQNSLALNAISANIILILVNFAIQLVQGNYIVPKLAGKEMNIHPSLILIFMLLFGSILGIWGVVLSIPLGGILIVVWNYMKDQGFLGEKEIALETNDAENKESSE